ncbi:MAG: hypothetical protein IPL61_22560 [Myxococcales bacterium]|nr:hypothetical protein [Myxococcales bacterium]
MQRFVVALSGVLALTLGACASSEVATPPDAAVDAAEVDAATDAEPAPDATDAAVDATDATPGPDACVPTAEVCNGVDDNCNLAVDETFPTLGQTCTAGTGGCVRTGMIVCDATGAGTTCSASAGGPTAETCNGADDDCDGMTDEGFSLGTACDGADPDLCTEGMIVCAATGGTTCSDLTGDSVELCNSFDDDCDTRVDEGFNLGAACDGPDTDACAEGVLVCGAGGVAVCNDATGSTVELCNGLDDDCQGGVDNGFPVGVSCSVGVGACARTGANVCNAAGNGVQCSATAGSPTAEICGDGIDQDCNGSDAICPTNDGPSGAINISGGGVFTVDLTAARNDQDFSGSFCGSTGGRDVFYTFTLPAAEVVYVDTFGSSFDTDLRVFAGSCTALGALQSCFDDSCSVLQSQGALALAAGQYCLVADQYSSFQTTGALTLTFTRGGRTGTAISTGTGTVTGTTVGAPNTWAPSCSSSSTAGEQAYYFLSCPAIVPTVAASTCTTPTSWDSVIYLRKAGVAADVTCNDDGLAPCGSVTPIRLSSFTGATGSGPGLYWLVVDGFLATTGAYTLNYTIN